MTMTAHQRWVLALTSMASLMILLDALVASRIIISGRGSIGACP